MEKNRKKITQLKWPRYQNPKDKNMGWTKQKKPMPIRQFKNSWKTPILILGGQIEFTFIPEFDYLS